MANRKWKEGKQQPSMLLGSAVPGSSLVSFYFLWAILCPQAVHCTKSGIISTNEVINAHPWTIQKWPQINVLPHNIPWIIREIHPGFYVMERGMSTTRVRIRSQKLWGRRVYYSATGLWYEFFWHIQGWAKEMALSWEKVSAQLQPSTAGHARLVLSKTVPFFCTSLYSMVSYLVVTQVETVAWL